MKSVILGLKSKADVDKYSAVRREVNETIFGPKGGMTLRIL